MTRDNIEDVANTIYPSDITDGRYGNTLGLIGHLRNASLGIKDSYNNEPNPPPLIVITAEKALALFKTRYLTLPRAEALNLLQISPSEFCDVIARRRPLRPQILKKMGLEKLIVYRQVDDK